MEKNRDDQARVNALVNSAPDADATDDELASFALLSKATAHRATTKKAIASKAAKINIDEKSIIALRTMVQQNIDYEIIKRSDEYQRCKRKLTSRQEKFMHGILAGDTLVDAYRAAYNIGSHRDDASVHADAWKLAQHPLIVLEMRQTSERLKDRAVMTGHQIREHVIKGLLKESVHAEQAGARVRAYELLGRIAEVSMFVTKTEVHHTHADPEEMKRLLMSKLYEHFSLKRGDDITDAALIEEKKTAEQQLDIDDERLFKASSKHSVRSEPRKQEDDTK